MILFLIAYYRFLGLVATLGLIVYAVFFFALMKLIPITLTLPGVAGLILTIGVAADSNIVIFERIKEEARKGHSMISAISAGYRSGIATIIDANVITLLTAFVLFGLATGGVKGFAFTLGVGVLVSLFTAVVFTRAVLGSARPHASAREPALLGATSQARPLALRLRRRQPLVLLDLGRDPADRRDLVRHPAPQLRHRLRVRARRSRRRWRSRRPSTRSATSLGDAGVDSDPNAVKIQSVTNPDFGDNVVQIQGTIDPTRSAQIQDQLTRTSACRRRAPTAPRVASTAPRSARRSAPRWRAAPPTRSSSRCS